MMGGACRHCGKVIACLASRGLCWACYRTPAIRALYPTYLKGPGGAACGREPTAEELERTIAEQMKALPEWWDHDLERERDREWMLKVYTLVRCS